MSDEFARGFVDFCASKIVELFPRWIEDGRSPDDGDLHSLAIKYVPVHGFTSYPEVLARPSGGWLLNE